MAITTTTATRTASYKTPRTVQAQLVLDSLPDLIRDAVVDIGVDLDNVAPSIDQPTTCFNYIPPDLQTAFAQGSTGKIQAINALGAKDMDPIYANMQQNQEQGWIQIINKSNKEPYWISIAGPPDNPTGYMWTYTNPIPLPVAGPSSGSEEPGFIHTVQVGTLSRNSKLLAAVVSTIVVSLMTKYISYRIAGTAFAEALSTATLRAVATLIARGIVTEAAWIAGATLTAQVVGGAVAGAALTPFDYVHCRVCVQRVVDCWGDNAEIDDDQSFIAGALPGRATEIKLPDGMGSAVVGEPAVSYCTYVFDNKNKVLEGPGVALSVMPEGDNKGLYLGYYLGRFKDNKLALSGNTNQTLSDFYHNKQSWAPSGSLKWSISLSDGTQVISSTPSLGGRSDQFYEYNVTIGLPPSKEFKDAPQPVPQPAPRPYPTIPAELQIGDKLTLHDGNTAQVVGKMPPPTKN